MTIDPQGIRMATRREFLSRLATGSGALLAAPLLGAACRAAAVMEKAAPAGGATASGWDRVPEILARVRPPVFADRDFEITSFGAVGDGTTDCYDALRHAIAACTVDGGGCVVVL